jgi:hypothetical protein
MGSLLLTDLEQSLATDDGSLKNNLKQSLKSAQSELLAQRGSMLAPAVRARVTAAEQAVAAALTILDRAQPGK